MGESRALVATGTEVVLQTRPLPTPRAHQVRIRVERVGVCRTDQAVAEGRLDARWPVVPGHEVTGVVDAEGAGVVGWLGQTVVVEPVDARGGFLGVHRDGAFARHVVVDVAQLVAVSAELEPCVRAFAEPVAACLAPVAHVGVLDRVAVVGAGRIAELTARCLRARGLRVVDPNDPHIDVLVETAGLATDLDPLLARVRPGGTLVLKSRRMGRVGFDVARALAREQTVAAAGYAPFRDAVALLDHPTLDLPSLIGPTFALSAWRRAFAQDEACKVFFDPWLEA